MHGLYAGDSLEELWLTRRGCLRLRDLVKRAKSKGWFQEGGGPPGPCCPEGEVCRMCPAVMNLKGKDWAGQACTAPLHTRPPLEGRHQGCQAGLSFPFSEEVERLAPCRCHTVDGRAGAQACGFFISICNPWCPGHSWPGTCHHQAAPVSLLSAALKASSRVPCSLRDPTVHLCSRTEPRAVPGTGRASWGSHSWSRGERGSQQLGQLPATVKPPSSPAGSRLKQSQRLWNKGNSLPEMSLMLFGL